MTTNNVLNLSAAGVVSYNGSGVFIGSTFSQYSYLIGSSNNGITGLGPATNGQILIGGTGVSPSLSTISAGSGISISNGSGSIQISASGNIPLSITTVNHAASPYTVLSGDQFLAVNSSAGTVSILLPNTTTTGRVIYVKDSSGNSGANNITITTVGGTVLIDGVTSRTLASNYSSINIIFDGTNYQIF